jgi:hypothetical protein
VSRNVRHAASRRTTINYECVSREAGARAWKLVV